MKRIISALLLWVAFAPGDAALAQVAPPFPGVQDGALEIGETGRVVEVIDGDTIVLAGGLEVRLVGIQAPKLPLGRPGFEAWPLAEEARARLVAMVLDREVTLYYGGRRVDRYGRALAHLVLDDGGWVQANMLSDGFARVYSFADNRALVPLMLDGEAIARRAGRGLWQEAYYRVLDQADAGRAVGSYGLVEGVVLSAARVRGRGFLNFGEDYRTDFTISIDPSDMEDHFDAADILLDDYVGARVRVRGWIRNLNGASIDVTHPEQIELIP